MTPPLSLDAAVSRFGASATAKLSNAAATGEPEDQLRAPLDALLVDLAALAGFAERTIIAVGETSLSDLKTRPDYAITSKGALISFLELKAPGKGADPRRFKDRHDRAQWEKLQSIPNLVYTDGNEFSLWRSGELVGHVVRLDGDVSSSGNALKAESDLQALFEDFLRWQPVAPRTAKQLAELTARLCRLLCDEVEEQMERGSPALTSLATDWRRLLFPDASDAHFADGYAQAVTFGLLVARARGLPLANGLDAVAKRLGQTDSLIGTALRLLTDSAENQRTLQTSIGTLVRVLDVVHWPKISKASPTPGSTSTRTSSACTTASCASRPGRTTRRRRWSRRWCGWSMMRCAPASPCHADWPRPTSRSPTPRWAPAPICSACSGASRSRSSRPRAPVPYRRPWRLRSSA